MDSNNIFGNTSNGNMDTNTDSSDESLADMYTRFVFMITDTLSLIFLLLLYTFTDKVKGTMLGKLMKSYCILSLLGLFGAFLHTLMEFVITVTNAAVCYVIAYLTYYAFMGSVISKVMFVCYIGYLFYKSYRMVLKDTTNRQIIKLKVGYFLTIALTPLTMLLIIIIHDHVLYEIKFIPDDMCIYIGEETFTVNTLVIYTVCFHAIAVLALIMIIVLLYRAYKTQKRVSQDMKNLFQIALAIVVAFVIVWVVYAFHPLYSSAAPQVLYFTLTVENVVIISVFVYNNKLLTKTKIYAMSLKWCNDAIVAPRIV